MSLSIHLQIVGVLLVLLGLSHAFFNWYFGWEKELAAVSLLTRRVFFVHSFFIALGVVLAGAGKAKGTKLINMMTQTYYSQN